MARVPVIDSPCPIVGKQVPRGATEHCTLCDRSVHNLDRMSARERTEFMSTCSGKVCVAYTVRIPVSALRKRGHAAAALLTAGGRGRTSRRRHVSHRQSECVAEL
jgi:hypothetical protein